MRQWNEFKTGGAIFALGICAMTALYQPVAARSEDQDGADKPLRPNSSAHKPGGRPNDDGGQNPDGGPPHQRREDMLAQQLDLTPQQQAKVQAILEAEREQMRLIHEKTRAAIEALLSAEQKTKFASMPTPGPGGKGPRGRGDRQQGGPNDDRQQGENRPHAQGEMHNEDGGRPVELIAKELGVTPEQFREAFKKVHPAAKGERPTDAQRQANRTALSQALGVSPEKLDAVMDKYRPEGPRH